MVKFKVGDEVVFIQPRYNTPKGAIGKIKSVNTVGEYSSYVIDFYFNGRLYVDTVLDGHIALTHCKRGLV